MSINIKINDTHRIVSDFHGYSIEKLTVSGPDSKEPGVESWVALPAFYSDLKSMLIALPEKLVRQEDISTIHGLVERIKYYQDFIMRSF